MANTMVDARGEQCPMPVVRAKKAIEGMDGAGVVEVLVDNEAAVSNIMRLASGSGLKAVNERLAGGEYRVMIEVTEKTDKNPGSAMNGSTVVAVDTDSMGRGSDELGGVLIKGFIYAVSQLECPPDAVLFYNGGAKLTVEGSPCLGDIKALQERGARVLTCGTCLNYYSLKEKLAVGSVTDMYTIAETLFGADKVIKP